MSDDLKRQPGETLTQFARRRAAALGITVPQPVEEAPQWDADLVPSIDPTAASPERIAIDVLIGGVDIVAAYNRWARKGTCAPGNRTESILVRCPNPAHPDKNPSAWLTLDKGDGGVGNCAVCGGFDKYDIAAWAYGHDVPSYRNSDFKKVIDRMAEDLGYRVMVQGKEEWAEKIEPASAPVTTAAAPTAPPSSVVAAPPAQPAALPSAEPNVIDGEFPEFSEAVDWQSLPTLQDDSFLRQWMEITSESHEPEDFYLWLGLLLLGMAIGNDVTLDDEPHVRGNLLLCLVGSTGTGKSIAIRKAEYLLHEALPFDPDTGAGVRPITSPGSGEALIDTFNYLVDDPAGGDKKITVPIRGLYRENELSTFVKKASRSGSTIREIMMEMLDSKSQVGANSRSAGMVVARNHYFSAVTSTQPEALGGLMSHTDMASGFLNRWVYAYGRPKRRPAISSSRVDVDPLIDVLRGIRAWATRSRVVGWHDLAGRMAFDAFYDANIRPFVEVDEGENPMLARLPLVAKKLVLLFAVNRKRTVVLEEDVQSVAAMWDGILSSYGVVADRVSVNDEADCAERIRAYLKARPDEAYTVRDIKKNSGARKYAKNGNLINKAILVLVAGGEIEEVPRPKNSVGQPSIKYRYVPDAEPQVSNVVQFPGGSV